MHVLYHSWQTYLRMCQGPLDKLLNVFQDCINSSKVWELNGSRLCMPSKFSWAKSVTFICVSESWQGLPRNDLWGNMSGSISSGSHPKKTIETTWHSKKQDKGKKVAKIKTTHHCRWPSLDSSSRPACFLHLHWLHRVVSSRPECFLHLHCCCIIYQDLLKMVRTTTYSHVP